MSKEIVTYEVFHTLAPTMEGQGMQDFDNETKAREYAKTRKEVTLYKVVTTELTL